MMPRAPLAPLPPPHPTPRTQAHPAVSSRRSRTWAGGADGWVVPAGGVAAEAPFFGRASHWGRTLPKARAQKTAKMFLAPFWSLGIG